VIVRQLLAEGCAPLQGLQTARLASKTTCQACRRMRAAESQRCQPLIRKHSGPTLPEGSLQSLPAGDAILKVSSAMNTCVY